MKKPKKAKKRLRQRRHLRSMYTVWNTNKGHPGPRRGNSKITLARLVSARITGSLSEADFQRRALMLQRRSGVE